MFETEVTKMLGIEYPIVGGAMMHITDADFVAAISDAGGLGILASAMYRTKEEFVGAIDRIRELTDKPFAVNINFFPSMQAIDNNEYVDVLIEKGVNIVETSGHSAPEEMCKRFKDAGMIWIHKCVGIRYALKVQGLGADIVTVVGYENGGATGRLDTTTMVLVPAVKDALKIPVIGGGGVTNGRGLVAVLALGAGAAIMGTRLLTTRECPIHDKIKEALKNANELDTKLVMRSINATHRVWINDAANKCEELEAAPEKDHDELFKVLSGDNTKRMFDTGDLGAGILSCGQGVGLAHDIPSVKEMFDRIISQAKDIAEGLAAG